MTFYALLVAVAICAGAIILLVAELNHIPPVPSLVVYLAGVFTGGCLVSLMDDRRGVEEEEDDR